jgi:PAS domain S-box-containing protein
MNQIAPGLPHSLLRPVASAQSVRLKRYFLAVGTSLMAIVLFYGCFAAGFISLDVFVGAALATLVLIGVFFAAFKTGWNLKSPEPSLLLPQATSAILVTSYVMAHAGPARSALLMLYLAAVIFAAFRFNLTNFIALAVVVMFSYLGVAVWAYFYDNARFDLRIEVLHLFFLGLMLPWMGGISSYLAHLRRRLHTGEALYRAIWEISIDAVLIGDERGVIRFANPAAGRMFGYAPASMVEMNLTDLIPLKRRDSVRIELQSYMRHGELKRDWRRFEEVVQNAQGREFQVEAAVAELGGKGGLPGLFAAGQRRMVVFVRDVSARHALDAIKDDFIATVSHELRTPLTSIIGAVEALQHGDGGELSPEARVLTEMAAKSADRLHELIKTLLNLNRIESGRLTFSPEPIEVSEVIATAVENTRPNAQKQQMQLLVGDVPPNVRVIADARWIHQVFLNLIDNALKFSPPGSNVEVGAVQGEGVIRFEVRDEGSGVPDNFADRIFGKFERADHSSTREQGGAGLGLSVCKAIVIGCRGRIGYVNNDERGATFWFELPLAKS